MVSAQTSTWTGGGGLANQAWSAASNWSGGAPVSSATQIADFTGPSSSLAPVVDYNIQLNQLNFAGADYTLSRSGAGSLSLIGATSQLSVGSAHTVTIDSSFSSGTLFLSSAVNNVDVAAGGTLDMRGSFSGVHLTKKGDGELRLGGSGAVWAGSIIHEAGVIQVDHALATPVSTQMTGSATLRIHDDITAQINNLIASSGTSVDLGKSGAFFGGSSGPIGATISGEGRFIKSGGSTTLSGVNTHTGGTVIQSSGQVQVSADANLGAAGAPLVIEGSGLLVATSSFSTGRNVHLGASGGTIVATGGDLTLTGVLAGTTTLTKSGASMLELLTTNPYAFSGNVIISGGAGAIKFGNGQALRQSLITLNSANQLDLNGLPTVTIGGLTGSGSVPLGATQLSVGGGSTYSGVLSSATGGGLTKLGSGGLSLSSAQTYNGPTIVNVGLSNAGNLNLSGAAGALTNSSTIEITGGGSELRLSNAVGAANSNRLPDAAPVTLKGGELRFTGATGALSETYGNLVLAGGHGQLNVLTHAAGASQLLGGTLSRSGRGTLLFESSASMGLAPAANNANFKFSAAPTLTGGGGAAASTTISILPYALARDSGGYGLATYQTTNGARKLAYATEYAATIVDGAANNNNVRLTAGATVGSVSTEINALHIANGGALNGAGTVKLRSGALLLESGGTLGVSAIDFGTVEGIVHVPASSVVVNSQLQGSNGVTFAGAGAVTLNVANPFTGDTTVNGTSVTLGHEDRLGAGDVLLHGGSLIANAPMTVSKNITLGDAGGVLSGAMQVDGLISGAGQLTINSGAMTLTNAANNFAGGLTLGGFNPVLSFSSDGQLGDAAGLLTANSGTFRPSFDWSTNRNFLGIPTIDTNGHNVELNGHASQMTKTGAGTLTLNGGSRNVLASAGKIFLNGQNYGSLTLFSGGTVQFSNDDRLAAPGQEIRFFGGVLQPGSSTTLARNLELVSIGGTIDTFGVDLDYRGTIYGSAPFIKTGLGTLHVNGLMSPNSVTVNQGEMVMHRAATYIGNTLLNGGVLSVSADDQLGIAASQLIFSGGTLRTTSDFSTARTITLSGTGTIETAGGDLTISQSIGGIGGLVKTGGDTLTLTGARNWTGLTSVNAGQLVLQGGGAPASNLVANATGTLRLQGVAADLAFRNVTANVGGVVQYSSTQVTGGFLRGIGEHRIQSGSSFAGTTLQAGARVFVDASTTFTDVQSGAALEVDSPLAWDGGANTASGRVAMGSTLTTQFFENNGFIAVEAGGTLSNSQSDLTSGGGSQIEIASGGQLNLVGGTELNLQAARLHNDGTISGATNVYHGSSATGTGAFGAVNVFSGGVFSPGASPGSATLSSLSFNPGGEYVFELSDAAGAAGVGYDSLTLTGALDVNAGVTPNSKFTLSVVSLDAMNQPGLASNFDPMQPASWLVASTGGINAFSAEKFTLDVSGFENATAGGVFSLVQSGDELRLAFAPGYAADFNEDGAVDGDDLVSWRDGFGDTTAGHGDGDADFDGDVDGSDFLTWQLQLGSGQATAAVAVGVPEPSAALLACVGVGLLAKRRRR